MRDKPESGHFDPALSNINQEDIVLFSFKQVAKDEGESNDEKTIEDKPNFLILAEHFLYS